MNESQFVTSLFVLMPEKHSHYTCMLLLEWQEVWSLCQIAVVLGNSHVTVTYWFILAPVVEWDIPEGNELLNTCLLISFC